MTKLGRKCLGILMLGAMLCTAGCSNSNNNTTEPTKAVENTKTETNTGSEVANPANQDTQNPVNQVPESELVEDVYTGSVTLEYPAHLQEIGFTEPITLEKMPERIVCLSTYPVLALFELGVIPIALPLTKVIKYPDNYTGTILPGMMSSNFDIEAVVAMEPDLVFLPSTATESYGATFESLNIPVYYVAMNSTGRTAYQVVKEQTEALVKGFSVTADKKAKAEEIMARFAAVEKKLEEFASVTEGKTVFSITVSGNSIYINGTSNTMGSMLTMCGLTNVYQVSATAGHSMNELDLETAIDYDPDIMVITGSSTLEDNKAMMQAIYEKNPEYWDTIPAFREGKVVYLPSSYVSTAGMNIIGNLEDLMVALREVLK